MGSLKIFGVLQKDELLKIVDVIDSELESVSSFKSGISDITIIGAEKIFARIGHNIGYYIVSSTTGSEQRVYYSPVGGGNGFGITLGAKKELDKEIGQAFEIILNKKGLRFEEISEQNRST